MKISRAQRLNLRLRSIRYWNWFRQKLTKSCLPSTALKKAGKNAFARTLAQNMARELKNAVEANVKQQVMDALLEAHQSLEVPKALVDQEITAMRQQMFQQFGGAGNMDLDLESFCRIRCF